MKFNYDITYKIYEKLESICLASKLMDHAFGEYKISTLSNADPFDILLFYNGRFNINKDIILLTFKVYTTQKEKFAKINPNIDIRCGVYDMIWDNKEESLEQIFKLIESFA